MLKKKNSAFAAGPSKSDVAWTGQVLRRTGGAQIPPRRCEPPLRGGGRGLCLLRHAEAALAAAKASTGSGAAPPKDLADPRDRVCRPDLQPNGASDPGLIDLPKPTALPSLKMHDHNQIHMHTSTYAGTPTSGLRLVDRAP